MTPEELQAIEERANKATPGQWRLHENVDGEVYVETKDKLIVMLESNFPYPNLPNAEFIAHAREDIPKLIEEVRRLREVIHLMKLEKMGL